MIIELIKSKEKYIIKIGNLKKITIQDRIKWRNQMSISQGVIIDEIKKLSLSEKILIIEEIWDDIVKNNEYPELTDMQYEELNRRIDSYHDNPNQGRTWDEIKKNFGESK